jgi:hypothetical protein
MKPKPSAKAGLRADPDALATRPPQASGKAVAAAAAEKLAAADGPAADNEPFVPEEEEEGPMTQGDGLMMAKARRQKSFDVPPQIAPPTPGGEPGEPDGGAPAEEDEFVPEEEEEGPSTQGDGLMAAKFRMPRGLPSPTKTG